MKASEPSEAAIQTMVHRFYGLVWSDPTLGPVFRSRLDHKRQAHLDHMCDFWSSILLGSREFVGNPMEAHRSIPEITSGHFDRWLELFRATVDEVFDVPTAENIFLRATHMRTALERGCVEDAALPVRRPDQRP